MHKLTIHLSLVALMAILILGSARVNPAYAGAHKLAPGAPAPTPAPPPAPVPVPTPTTPQVPQSIIVGTGAHTDRKLDDRHDDIYGKVDFQDGFFANFVTSFLEQQGLSQDQVNQFFNLYGNDLGASHEAVVITVDGGGSVTVSAVNSSLAQQAFQQDTQEFNSFFSGVLGNGRVVAQAGETFVAKGSEDTAAARQGIQRGSARTLNAGITFGAPSTVTVNGQMYNVVGATFRFVSPIVLDVGGDRRPDVAEGRWLPHPDRFYRQHLAVFDLDGDGVPKLSEWVGPRAGLLCVPDENGEVTSARQLFGTAGGYKDGYEKLEKLYDKDHKGYLEGDELKGLYVWIDANGDGQVQKGELIPVQQMGITRISTRHQNYVSTYVVHGETRYTWDWWPNELWLARKP